MQDAVLLILAMASMVPLFFCFFFGERIGFLSPTTYLISLEMLGVFIQTMFMVFFDGSPSGSLQLFGSGYLSGILLVTIFNTAYFFGWVSISSSFAIPRLPYFLSPGKKRVFAFLFFAVGFLLMYEFFIVMDVFSALKNGVISAKRFSTDGNVDGSYGFLRLGGDVVLVYGLIKLIDYYENKSVLSFYIYLFSAVSAALFYFVLSTRMSILTIVICTLIVVSANGGVKKKDSAKYLVLLLFFVAMILTMGSVRKNKGAVEDLVQDKSLINKIEESHIFSGNYFFTINKAMLVTDEVPRNSSHMLGKTFLPPLYFFIPRSLWPDKPLVRYGPKFAEDVYGKSGDSGIPPSFPVELYWNFSWLGVFCGGLFLGILSKIFIMKSTRKGKRKSSFDYCIYIAFFMVPLMVGDFSGSVIGFFMVSIFYLAMKPQKRGEIGEGNA